jgi:hypothetical protein
MQDLGTKHKTFQPRNVFMKKKNYTEAVEAYKNAAMVHLMKKQVQFCFRKKMLKEIHKDNKDKDKR